MKIHSMDEYGRHAAKSRYGDHATSTHGHMAMKHNKAHKFDMDTGGAVNPPPTLAGMSPTQASS